MSSATCQRKYRYEKELWALGFKYIGGIDEAGRGAWAGPFLRLWSSSLQMLAFCGPLQVCGIPSV